MQSHKGRFEPTKFDDLTVTVDFHCHSACRFCIVQEGMNFYRGVPFETFKEAVDRNRSAPRYARVTFTGGEVTLEAKLFDYIGYAKASGSFDHVRIQTNGRRLADAEFLQRLLDAGVDEYFVSLHGPDAATQDHISQRPGSFDEAVRGLANIRRLGGRLITNTVLTTLNVQVLADIVDTVLPFGPERMEFWNYLPMEDYADERDLLAPMSTLAPALRSALDRAKSHGVPTTVKYVPMCLLGEHAAAVDNAQPDVVIVEEFYDKYPKFACLYEAKCEHADTCLGLHHPYITKFGWEEGALRPVPRTTAWAEPEYGAWLTSEADDGSGGRGGRPRNQWVALVEGVAERHGGRLAEVLLQRRACVFRFAYESSSVDFVLTARDSGPALARSRSFDMHYRNLIGGRSPALSEMVKEAVRAVRDRDTGALQLDRRKGLVGPDAVRARRPKVQRGGT